MQEITFWDLISSTEIKRISIPTIQRDYAQGRRNKVYIRHNFLNALKDALCTGKQLILDFIYGVDNETMFIPLDGQQLFGCFIGFWHTNPANFKKMILNVHLQSFRMKLVLPHQTFVSRCAV